MKSLIFPVLASVLGLSLAGRLPENLHDTHDLDKRGSSPIDFTTFNYSSISGFDQEELEFEPDFKDEAKTIVLANGANYTFFNFLHIKQYVFAKDTPEVSDMDYYEYTVENLKTSSFHLFYPFWTMHAQRHPEFHTRGEWGLFAMQFLGSKNFQCSLDIRSCPMQMVESNIIDMYRHNRPLGRVVLFATMLFIVHHDLGLANLEYTSEAGADLNAHALDLVRKFTYQPDKKKIQTCKLIKEIIKTTISFTATVFTSGVSSALPKHDALKEIFALAFDMGKRMKQDSAGDWIMESIKWTVEFNPIGKLIEKTPDYVMKAIEQHVHGDKGLQIDQGYGTDIICGGFEGDAKDRKGKNTEKLEHHISKALGNLRNDLRRGFNEIVNGKIIAENLPTELGMQIMKLSFTDAASIRQRLRDFSPDSRKIKRAIYTDAISHTAASDGNYVKCTHLPDAPYLCAQAARYRQEIQIKAEPKYKLTEIQASQFCPEPETDPRRICQAERMYHHKTSTHLIAYAPLWSFEKSPLLINETYESVMAEAYANFQKYGNNMLQDFSGFRFGEYDAPGFRVPFCLNDIYQLGKYSGSYSDGRQKFKPDELEVPACCGTDCEDTQAFFGPVQLAINSTYYLKTDGRRPVQFYRDRIPMTLEKLVPNPVARYLAYASAGISFPVIEWPTNSFFNGIDPDVPIVRKYTASLDTDFKKNLWFCRDGHLAKEHTVFAREKGLTLMNTRLTYIQNHKTICEIWLNKWANKIDS